MSSPLCSFLGLHILFQGRMNYFKLNSLGFCTYQMLYLGYSSALIYNFVSTTT